MLPPDSAPLILTLALDPASQAHFNALRQEHFPKERNYLQAHVTLFHHLPAAEKPAIEAELRRLSCPLPPLTLRVTGLRFMGRGVAYDLENTVLQQLHKQLQTTWAAWLTPQDQQRLKPHITVQNKVNPAVARALHAELAEQFTPFEVNGTGLHLWAYRGGPWEKLQEFAFSGEVA
ncbi:2'-5' RNA ligase family protein [Hymenobacter taeanensis]|uniref:2'-5' RNA ligase family protein n=1 Tax=Hymenobacter taeanensis TaxID=2735321 RepID=A0A6M6BIU1_9BACT|nr:MULTISPECIES: 2'-5' RNA ligase family protein [Hymenobacter]QJX48057.1 2'-5' RNA ligase family protein [Hymenobacter taeanensis]UOQ82490.1 2'-5' RNA ligase family protein [Hymenobacter sp. 5414T-23]